MNEQFLDQGNVKGKIKPDYRKCLDNNEHWTRLVIAGIQDRLNNIYVGSFNGKIINSVRPETKRAFNKRIFGEV